MDASLRWHDEEGSMDASLKVNCACTREAILGCRWHDEEMAKGCFYLRRIRDALRRLFPEIRDEPFSFHTKRLGVCRT